MSHYKLLQATASKRWAADAAKHNNLSGCDSQVDAFQRPQRGSVRVRLYATPHAKDIPPSTPSIATTGTLNDTTSTTSGTIAPAARRGRRTAPPPPRPRLRRAHDVHLSKGAKGAKGVNASAVKSDRSRENASRVHICT